MDTDMEKQTSLTKTKKRQRSYKASNAKDDDQSTSSIKHLKANKKRNLKKKQISSSELKDDSQLNSTSKRPLKERKQRKGSQKASIKKKKSNHKEKCEIIDISLNSSSSSESPTQSSSIVDTNIQPNLKKVNKKHSFYDRFRLQDSVDEFDKKLASYISSCSDDDFVDSISMTESSDDVE